MKNNKKIIFILLFAIMGLFGFQKAQAIEYEMLGGKPAFPDPNVENSESWFIYSLAPGETKEDAIEVANLFNQSWEALVYAADTTKSSSGGFALKQFSEPKLEVGSWVRFYPNEPPDFFKNLFERKDRKILGLCMTDEETLKTEMNIKEISDENLTALKIWCQGEEYISKNLETKQRIVIPFIIRIPENAEIGEHTGGILIQKANPDVQSSGSGSAINLTTRVGVRIYETVPGEIIRTLKLDGFSVTKNFDEFSFADWFGNPKKLQEYTIQTKTKNDGNVSIEQAENIKIKDLLFDKKNSNVERSFQVLKKDSFISNYAWNNPRFGHFAFSTEIKYKDSEGAEAVIESEVVKRWIMPWREMTIALILFALAFAGYFSWRFYHKKKYGGIGWIEYKVKKSDNINSLADKFEIDWKVLAKTNKIEAPYLLEAGQMLLVPSSIKEEIKDKENQIRVESKPAETKEIGAEITNDLIIKEEDDIEEEKDFVQEKSGNNWIKLSLAFLAGLVIGGIIVAGILTILEKKKSQTLNAGISITNIGGSPASIVEEKAEEKSVAEENNVAEEKNVVQEKTVELADINIKILNGGAVAGSAGKLKTVLTGKGYKKIEAQNAEGNYAGTVMYYAEGFKDEAELAKTALKDKYPNLEVKEGTSAEEKSADLVIVLGK